MGDDDVSLSVMFIEVNSLNTRKSNGEDLGAFGACCCGVGDDSGNESS